MKFNNSNDVLHNYSYILIDQGLTSLNLVTSHENTTLSPLGWPMKPQEQEKIWWKSKVR